MKRSLIESLMELFDVMGILRLAFAKAISESETNLLVLTYHDVVSGEFSKHINFLLKYFNFWSLDKMVAKMKKHEFPSNPTVVITFDDGRESIYNDALPVLDQYNIPAICYISTGILDSELWVNPLTGCSIMSGNSRKRTVYGIHSPIPETRKQAKALGFLIRTGLSMEQLVCLRDHPYIELGSHTITHPNLVDLDDTQCEYEINHSRIELEEILNRPVNHFAYPYGSFGVREMRFVVRAGYKSAAGELNHWFSRSSSIFAFPRIGTARKGISVSWLQFRIARRSFPFLNHVYLSSGMDEFL